MPREVGGFGRGRAVVALSGGDPLGSLDAMRAGEKHGIAVVASNPRRDRIRELEHVLATNDRLKRGRAVTTNPRQTELAEVERALDEANASDRPVVDVILENRRAWRKAKRAHARQVAKADARLADLRRQALAVRRAGNR